jgi:thermitase
MKKRTSLAIVPLAATVACSTPATLEAPESEQADSVTMMAKSSPELSDVPVGTVEGRFAEIGSDTQAVPDDLRAGFDALTASDQLAGSAMATWIRTRSEHPELARTIQNAGERRYLIQARKGRGMPALPGWRIVAQQPLLNAVVATPADPAALQSLLARTLAIPELSNVEAETIRTAAAAPADPMYATLWAWPKIKADLAHDAIATAISGSGNPGSAVPVAVLDTGVQIDHQDLAGNMIARDPADNRTTFPDGAVHRHGTHVAGTIAAVRDNGLGIAGIAPEANILDVKVLGDNGAGYSHWISSGIIQAATRGAKVINVSLGSSNYSESERSAVDQAMTGGALVVAAAGNENTSAKSYPAAHPGVLSVMASTPTDTRASFSNYGPWCLIAAPGTNIQSTVPISAYGSLQGTSVACPHVAGAAAVVLQAAAVQGISLRPAQISELLLMTGQPLPRFYGTTATVPLLDLQAAVSRILTNVPPVDRVPTVSLSKPVVTANAATLPFSADELVKIRLWTQQGGTRLVPGGLAPSSGNWFHDNPLATSGQAVMTGLRPNTTYAYQLEAEDTAAQQALSEVGTFKTQPVTYQLAVATPGATSLLVTLARNVSNITGVTVTAGPTA